MNFIQYSIFSLLGVSTIMANGATITLDDSNTANGYFAYKANNNTVGAIGEMSSIMAGKEGLYISGSPNMSIYLNTAEISSGADLLSNQLTIKNAEDIFLKSSNDGVSIESGKDITLTALQPENDPNALVGNIILNAEKGIINADTEVNGSLTLNGEEVITKSPSGLTSLRNGLQIGPPTNTVNSIFNAGGLAVGHNNTTYGYGLAVGYSNTINSNQGVITVGRDNTVSGNNSIVAGSGNVVGDVNGQQASYVFGAGNKVPNGGNFVYGTSNELGESTYVSSVHGTYNKITAQNSGVMVNGWSNNISSIGSFTAGYYLENNSHSMIALGYWNKPSANADANNLVDDDHLFVIGNGTSETTRSNAFVVLKNGDIIIPKVQGDVAMGIFGD